MDSEILLNTNEINIVRGKYQIEDVCRKIVNNYRDMDELFAVMDLSEVVRRFLRLKEIMPRVEQFYAMKCNPNENIVKVLAAVGCNFECASTHEIDSLLKLNIDQDRIIFANPSKPVSQIEYVARHQVMKMVFDSEVELRKIHELFPNAELVLRFRCDAKKADFMLGEKYGCNPVNDAPRLLKIAKELQLNVIGVSFHVGCGCQEPEVYGRAIKFARDIFNSASEIGYVLKFLDIGGGFPGKSSVDVKPITDIINEALNKYFPEDNVRIISEFGQYYVTAACTIISTILGKRKTTEESTEKIMYFINDSVMRNFVLTLNDVYHFFPRPLFPNLTTTKQYKTTIWGCTMEPNDKIHDNILLPEMNCGDYLAFDNMGAYSQSCESIFCRFSKTLVYTIINEFTYDLIKNHEIFKTNSNLVEFKLNN